MPSRAARQAPYSGGAAKDPFSEGALSEDDLQAAIDDTVVDLTEGTVEGEPTGTEIAEISPDGDGGEIIEFRDPATSADEPEAHDANLAETLPPETLTKISSDLLQSIAKDVESRREWQTMLTEGIKFLGLKLEDREWPFPNASGVYDTTMLEATIRWHAVSTAELLPAGGPVKTQIIGLPTENTEMQASRVKDFMNFYFTEGAPEWTEENNQMLFWLPLVGSTIKKTYQDPVLNRPVSPFILPQDFIVPWNTSDLDTCPRVTERIRMSFKEARLRQLTGFYRDIELGDPSSTTAEGTDNDPIGDAVRGIEGVTKGDSSGIRQASDQEHIFYECHVDLDIDEDAHIGDDGKPTGLPRPYIVTIDASSRDILAIRRNWKEGDQSFQKIQYFTHFRFIPGLGFYGIGYAHILGNPAKGATGLQRQMIDATTLEMFPGGLKVKGMRLEDNNLMIGPCEFREIDTGGMPINQAVTHMPYKGASEVAFQLWGSLRELAEKLASTTEIAVGEGRQDAPVGTTVAMMEAANRIQSATIKNAHRAYRREFKLFAALFGEYLPEQPYPYPVSGGQGAIMRADFSDAIDVIPVSDPNITSSAQRMMRAEALLRFATQAPQLHDQYQAYRQMYVEMGVDERKIDKLLPPPQSPQPADPLTENQNMLTGKPVTAGLYQDHAAHIQAHQPLAESVPTAQAHIAEHLALQMRVQVQQILGVELPPPGTKLPPQIENQIAMLVAQAMQHLQMPGDQEPSPGQIAMAQIQTEAKKIVADLQESKAKTAREAYKETMRLKDKREERDAKLQVEQMRVRSAEKIARLNAIGRQRATANRRNES